MVLIFCYNNNNALNKLFYVQKGSQQHPEFPSGLPSKYYLGPMLLNFSDRDYKELATLSRSLLS